MLPVGVMLLAGFLVSAQVATAPQPEPARTPGPRLRVPTAHANVHAGPSSTTEVLVLVARGTVLEEIGRDGEWIQVRLHPEFRETGLVMRWYKNEDRGWMHDSTVELVKNAPR